MSARALRDEIEALHSAILAERAKLAVPIEAELRPARAALQAEVEELFRRVSELARETARLEEQTRLRKQLTKMARADLSSARSEIGSREPLGNPLEESRSNWEDPTAGCGIGVLVLLSSAAVTWWLS